ncbi:MAG: efflux RND transporter permease subunit [Cyclonatronaceae bacterium]
MLLNRPVTAFMLVLATFIFGYVALNELSVDLLPDIDTPSLLVRTEWSGASAREIETRITEPMEAVLSTIPGVQRVHSFSRQGQGITALEFEWGRDMNLAFLNTREKLDQVRYFLPEQAGRPQLIYTTPTDEPVAVLQVTALGQPDPGFATRLDLKRWTEQVLTRRLEQVDGIAQAVMVGALTPEVHIRFNPQLADRYGISIQDVQQVIREANVFSASGELRDGWYRYSLNIETRIQSLQDITHLPVMKMEGERIIRLSDIAEVEMGEQDPLSFALVDGFTALTVLVKKDYGTNTVTVFQRMLPEIESLGDMYPGISVEVLSESATYIKNTISNLLQTLLIGGVLAFMVLFLFLNDPRMPFTIGIAIPVSIFLTFFVMYLAGIQLNIVSLSGLTLGIGLLVDNAIVVLENINRYRKSGSELYKAASAGTREIALAITASTFTTISVFLPLIFLGGFEGAFFRDQAFTLSIALLASLLVALGILPVLVVQFQRRKRSDQFRETRFTSVFEDVKDRYERSLQSVLHRPLLPLVALALILIAAFAGFNRIGKSVLPDTREQRIQYRVSLPGNTSIFTARQAAGYMMEELTRMGGFSGVLAMGGYTDQTNVARLAREGMNKFTLEVPVGTADDARQVHRFLETWSGNQPGWTFEPIREIELFSSILGDAEAPVVFRFVGQNRDITEQAAERLAAHITNPGSTFSMARQYPEEVDTYHIRFITERIMQLGLSERQVIDFMESRARGNMITEWNREDESIALRLFTARDTGFDPGDIRIPVRGRSVPVREIATISRVPELQQLERIDQAPVLSYVTSLSLADWWFNKDEVRRQLTAFTRDTGIQVRVGGSAVQVDKLLRDMGKLLLISLILIYIILAVQYENLKYPLIVLFAVPFAWVGSIFLLWAAGSTLNTLSLMGVLILTGIAVNDAILKVDFMRRYLAETGNLDEAIRQAGLHRFRPVVMTTLTTTLGLLPMIIPIGDGYEFRQALGLALMGGMITSTLLTLYLIPLIFKWVETITSGRKIPEAVPNPEIVPKY